MTVLKERMAALDALAEEEAKVVPTLCSTNTGLDEQGPFLENEERKESFSSGGFFTGGTF